MVIAASGQALSVAANSTSTNQITNPAFLMTGAGTYTLFAKATAVGMTSTFKHGGFPVADAAQLLNVGATGSLSLRDNLVFSTQIRGGMMANELKFTNTTGGALTVDFAFMID